METMKVNFKLDDNYQARLQATKPSPPLPESGLLAPSIDSGPPKIVQMDSFNPSFNLEDDYEKKLEPARALPQPKDAFWYDINDVRNELNSKSGQGSTSFKGSHKSSETKNAFTGMGTHEVVGIRKEGPSEYDDLSGPPPITQMETMNVNFSPNDDYNG
jgi:hypothetical protein